MQFPDEILTKVFSQLTMEDLLNATAVCKAWQHVATSEALWELICQRRWRSWTGLSKYGTGSSEQTGPRWRTICQERVGYDNLARAFVSDMAWPLKRHSCLKELTSLSDLVTEDHPFSSTSNFEGPYVSGSNLGRRRVVYALLTWTFGTFIASQAYELERLVCKAGALEEGTRYFAAVALERINQSNCVKAMQSLLATPQPELEDSLARGALIIAKLRYQDLDIDAIESKLDDYRDILLCQLRQDPDISRFGGLGTPGGALAGLKQLNMLLFGQPRNASQDENVESEERSADDPQGGSERTCLHFRGNRDDSYNPANLYLNEVLECRKGVEISLAIIHSAVGRRCKIPVQMVAIPMHFVTKVGEEGMPYERFVNVFDSGQLLLRTECIDLIQSMGLDYEPKMLACVPASSVFVAMCENLIAIYSQGNGEQDVRQQPKERQRMLLPLLNMVLAINPADCSNRFSRVKVLLESSDFKAALGDLKALLKLMDTTGVNDKDGISRALLQQYLQNAEEKREHYAAWCRKRRSPRPREVLYNVGDIVRHVRLQYPGIIFGWDKEFSLDDEWITPMKIDLLQYGRAQPFYRVLVDQNFRNTSTYVAQENITVARDIGTLIHEELGMHFLGYRNGKYVPNSYLSYLYPEDVSELLTESAPSRTSTQYNETGVEILEVKSDVSSGQGGASGS